MDDETAQKEVLLIYDVQQVHAQDMNFRKQYPYGSIKNITIVTITSQAGEIACTTPMNAR